MPDVMFKKDLADRFAEQFDITKKDAIIQLQFLLDEMTAELEKGNTVDLSGFGKFVVKTKAQRDGFNPTRKEKITVEAHNSVRFKPAKALKEAIK